MLQYLKKVILDYLSNDKNKVNYLAGKVKINNYVTPDN